MRITGLSSALLLAAAALVVGLPATALAGSSGKKKEPAPQSAVYVQTNTAENAVQVYKRAANGSLTAGARLLTGGAGNPAGNPPLDIPYLDSQGSVELSGNGRHLFVVNAGDDTVTSFRITGKTIKLADRKPTGGSRPISATSERGLLYVLNSAVGSASITGFRVSSKGKLTPIAGSTLNTTTPAEDLPAQIDFRPGGRQLVVSDRGTDTLDTFAVSKQGVASAAVSHPSTGKAPFGIDFTKDSLMVVSNEHFPKTDESTVSSYVLTSAGVLGAVDLQPAQSGGACWTVITNDGKFVYVTSPFTGSVVAFRITAAGTLSPVTANAHVADVDGLTLDEALSHNSRFLYVLKSAMFASDTILIYEVNADGTLTARGETAAIEGSAAGLAAW